MPHVKVKTGESDIERKASQKRALELRKYGATFQQISDQMELSGPGHAHRLVTSAMKEMIREPTEELRDMELHRLDGLLVSISPQVRSGHLGAVDRALKIMERRARLLGLDLQKDGQVSVTTNGQAVIRTSELTPESRDALERMLREAAGRLPPEDA